MTAPLVPGCRLEPSASLRSLDRGRVLIGGSPLRILRLSATGAEVARGWFAGEAIGGSVGHQQLARRLEAAGMAHLRWPVGGERDDARSRTEADLTLAAVTVVIPTHDDRPELDRTLAALNWCPRIIVSDDGSTIPVVVDRHGVTTVRSDRPAGPGSARNLGLGQVETPLTLFVDAGVTVDRSAVDQLVACLADPSVVAAAPRVGSEPGPGLVARYEGRRSPLDLGAGESLVGPGRNVPYVPTACLLVRSDAVRQAGGFDPDLRYGEDVDLVWRLGRQGLVRYLPQATAIHRPRASLRALAAQRVGYGSAAAPLARRHGHGAVSPCRISPWTVTVAALALAGRPVAAVAAAVGTGLALRPKIQPMPAAGVEALLLAVRGHGYGVLSVAAAALRVWAPIAAVALVRGGAPARLAGRALLAGVARRIVDGPRDAGDLAIDLGVGAIDDLAYCAGVWRGAIAERSIAALRPELVSWPNDRRAVGDRIRSLAGRSPADRATGPATRR